MGSRNRTKKRKPSSSHFAARTTFEDAGVHTPSFVVGMVLSLLTILLIWNHFAMSDSTRELLAAADSGKSSKSAVPIQPKTRDAKLESADLNELCSDLIGLNDAVRKKRDPRQAEADDRLRVDICNKLINKFALDEEQRVLANKSKIDALASLYGRDFQLKWDGPNVGESLRSAAETSLKDANPVIAKSARMALMKYHAFERLKRPTFLTVEQLADEFIQMLKDYRDDEVTLATIRLITEYYVKTNIKEAIVLVQKIKDASLAIESLKLNEMIREVADEAKMKSLDYLDDFENFWLNGEVGEKELVRDSATLLSDPQYGYSIIHNVDRVAHWFEQEDQYDRAISIYREMLKSSESNESLEVATLARKTAENGMTRAGLINRKIDLSGVAFDGTPIDPEFFDQRVVIVLFWSSQDQTSFQGLNQIYKETSSLRNRGLKILAVSVDTTINGKLKTFMESKPEIVFAVGDPESKVESQIWKQCPSSIVPRVMLVDQNGVVVDINVSVSNVATEAGFLMSGD